VKGGAQAMSEAEEVLTIDAVRPGVISARSGSKRFLPTPVRSAGMTSGSK